MHVLKLLIFQRSFWKTLCISLLYHKKFPEGRTEEQIESHIYSKAFAKDCLTMVRVGRQRKWHFVLGLAAMVLFFLLTECSVKTPLRGIPGHTNSTTQQPTSLGVQLRVETHQQVVISNDILKVTLSIPDGNVLGIQYKGIDNLLATQNEEDNRGYWDVVWNKPGDHIRFDNHLSDIKLRGTDFRVIVEDENQVELSFTMKWEGSISGSAVPLNVDKRFIMLSGSSGFYSYAIFERLEGWPDVEMDQIRIVYKLQKDKFQFMCVSDVKKRVMPMPQDRVTGQPLAYPEAVLLTDPINPTLRGEVDDKYQYSCENKDNNVHGWICSEPPVGFWIITPSNEFRTAGPIKQDLTSHVGPTTLSMFVSTHYAGKEVGMKFRNGEPWKKVFGPVFVYLNSLSSKQNPLRLWEDANEQMLIEAESWPYDFPQSNDFPTSDERGIIAGQLLVHDPYVNERYMWADSAYVGLAPPGDVGSWQKENKGYQFWTRASEHGYFLIEKIRAGPYNLYAWVPGFIGDYKYAATITIEPGSQIKMGVLVYEPPRDGPTLWEIGIPDRSAAEFFVPDPYTTLLNLLYINHQEKYRQYGLWERYADMYPEHDLTYTVGASDYSKHWFFAHVTRNVGNMTYQATTWQIIFELPNLNNTSGNHTLRIALASANESELQVRFNNRTLEQPDFSTGLIGKDNAIARHGIHGLYWLYSINVPSFLLVQGNNTIFLTQSRSSGPFQGIMYDYIRLEGPSQT